MWKSRKEEEPQVPTHTTPPVKEVNPVASPIERKPMYEPEPTPARGGMAHIGKSVLVKGELSGNEDLYIDGEIEGTVELKDHNLTIGPNGRVKANLHAKEVTVLGKVQGNVRATDKLEIRKSGSLVGDIITARITIEDGAYFKGSIDIQRQDTARAAEARRPEAAAAAAPPQYAGVGGEKKTP
jgi:cytoskeletal protein CcmA (bactofilin family)